VSGEPTWRGGIGGEYLPQLELFKDKKSKELLRG